MEVDLSRRREFRAPRLGRFLPPFGHEFVNVEVLSGWVLLVGAGASLAWVNVDGESFRNVWHHVLTIGLGDAAITLDLRHWVSDGLMAIFFFVVGMEIKREIVDGELRNARTAMVPALAALGGMVVPAAAFAAATAGSAGGRGWAVPMATDIAFAVGVLAVLGRRVPPGAKLFLLTLAIVDDIGAILVIAVFYSGGLDGAWLLGALAAVGMVMVLRRIRTVPLWTYAVPGVVMWVCVHESGVHATIAGVTLGLLVPVAAGPDRGPLERIEDALHPWSSFLVVPLFALANAGVVLDGRSIDAASTSAVAGGIALGLVVGKPVGIVAATMLALRSRRARLPSGMRVPHVLGVGLIAGMGFTVSLFIANLSFAGVRLEEAKLAILGASLVAAILGAMCFVALDARERRRSSA